MNYIEGFIKDCKEGRRLTDKGKRYKVWTIKDYKTLLYYLNEYLNKKSVKLYSDYITTDFYSDFLGYFNENSFATNTIRRNIKNIKVMMSASFDEGLHKNIDFQKRLLGLLLKKKVRFN